MTTAHDILALLRRHYLPENRPPGGVFAPEIESPCGRRRADLIWLPTTTGQQGLVGHEVKVSRADVLSELADPTKADPWMRFCSHWWLVVSDPKLVDGLGLPATWGVMSPPSGRRTRSMTIVRPAPNLQPLDTSRALHRLAAWMLYRHTSAEGRLQCDLESERKHAKYLQERLNDRELGAAVAAHPMVPRVRKIIAELDRLDWRDHLRVEDDAVIVAAIADWSRLRRVNDDLRRSLNDVVNQYDRSLSNLKRIHDDLAVVREALPDPTAAMAPATLSAP